MNSLAGYNVLEISRYPAGAILGMILADAGASVSKIIFPDIDPAEETVEFSVWNRGKNILEADIFNDPGALTNILEMSTTADIIIECLDPNEIENLSLTYKSLEGEAIVVSLPCFPPGHTLDFLPPIEEIASASSGIYSLNPAGRVPVDGEGPSFHGLYYSSSIAAMTASSAVLGALIQKTKTGLGQQVFVPLHDSMYQGMGGNLIRHSKRSEGRQVSHPAVGRAYKCKDGKWLNINMSHPRFLEPFLKSIDRLEWFKELSDVEKLLSYPDHLHVWKEKFNSIWKSKTSKEWEDQMGEIGVPGSVSRTIEEWIKEDQALISGAIIDIEDPYFGNMKQPGKLVQNIEKEGVN